MCQLNVDVVHAHFMSCYIVRFIIMMKKLFPSQSFFMPARIPILGISFDELGDKKIYESTLNIHRCEYIVLSGFARINISHPEKNFKHMRGKHSAEVLKFPLGY